ncbi:MAG: membrane protein insertase YidC [Clostridia bacterium]|nr:membrane protein insertase YidC [Clostridia bacterium]
MGIFNFLAKPLGWLMWVVYEYIGFHNYFLTIFLFTLLTRILMFPLSLKNQKSMMDRARLAPRIERLQKKYANDKQKLQQKQQALYEKEGVSMFGGCLPTMVTMIVLFGVIAAIYAPLTYLMQIPEPAVKAAISAVTLEEGETKETSPNKYAANELGGYYGEFRMLEKLEENKDAILTNMEAVEGVSKEQAQDYLDRMRETKKEFTVFGYSLLKNPGEGGFAAISPLWLLPIIAALSQLAMTMQTMKYTQRGGSAEAAQQQGCSKVMMYGMPLFSLVIGFTFPGGVSIYWICSSIIGFLQTMILYKIYDPAKAREQAEIEYQERRRRKAEDKKRLAEARAHQDAIESAADAEAPVEIGDVTPDEIEASKKKNSDAASDGE